ncbi:MAG: protein translocase subunit SecD [Rickettsiales bacterium]|nr:protein translocase subunit SecD [Rickettsiales bacterium]
MPDFPLWKSLTVLFVTLLFTYFTLPTFLSPEARRHLPASAQDMTLNLGLDLRGGSHLLLEVDFDSYFREQRENLRTEIRTALREIKLGYRDFEVTADSVRFSLPEHAESRGGSLDDLRGKLGTDYDVSENAGAVSISLSDMAKRAKRQQLIEQSIEIVSRRVNETGTKEPIIQRQGDKRILLQVPGLSDPAQLKEILGTTAKMTFHLVNMNATPEQVLAGRVPLGTRLLPSDDISQRLSDGQPYRYPVYNKVELSGEMLTGANASYQDGQPVVSFQFNSIGAKKFGEITQKNVGRPFAIVLDDKVITAPRINTPILNGSGIISGSFTVESANNLALLLRAGALPAPLKIVEERSVGPSLGNDSIEAGKRASLIGLVAVVGFMLLSYGLLGIFASMALLVNIVMLLGALAWFQATLTLPGIAGIVLTFGMAVDANVLIFERIREEAHRGRSPASAVNSGFKAAFATIMDSNITTLIAAALLFSFGTGSIKGFAVTLTVGILSSMFSAIMVTRMLIALWIHTMRPRSIPL